MISPLMACMVLTAISFLPRIFPFLLGKQLKKSVHLDRLTRSLPPCIMLLLVAHMLHQGELFTSPKGPLQLVGVAAVVAAHLLWKRAIVSMAVGFTVYQFLVLL